MVFDQSHKIARKTGRCVDDIVAALIKKGADGSDDVRAQARRSLLEIGAHEPMVTLTLVADMIAHNSRLKEEHRVDLIRTLRRLFDHAVTWASNSADDAAALDELSLPLVHIALGQLVAPDSPRPEWQGAAAELTCRLAQRWPQTVLDSVLEELLPPGELPQYYVLKVLADLTTTSAKDVAPKVGDILGRLTPVLGQVRKDADKWVAATALGRLAHTVKRQAEERAAESESDALTLILQEGVGGNFASAFEIVFVNWRQTRDARLRRAIAESLGAMCEVLMADKFVSHLPPLIAFFRE
ncbi:MAG: hypothetical protein MHM6MM_007531, partial [Cercozoa sp. M6MM]